VPCCKGKASWFCCYPDPCGCDGGCCQGNNCSAGCSSSSKEGLGACCTCNSGNWGFAWRTTSFSCGVPCGLTHSCGDRPYFSKNCTVWNPAHKVDTGPACGLGRMTDFTKSLFMQFAPLSAGVVSNIRMSGTIDCC
jgi:hypothetical protein